MLKLRMLEAVFYRTSSGREPVREWLKDLDFMVDSHYSHVDILRELALQEIHGGVMRKPPRVIVVTMKNHAHQTDLAQGIELRPRTTGTDCFSTLDKAKRGNFLPFAVVRDMEIVGLQIVYRAAFLVADYHVE